MGSINIKTLNLEELTGLINLYPWYAAARKELCLRMAKIAGENWGKQNFVDASLFIIDRNKIYDIYNANKESNYYDKQVTDLVKNLISKKSEKKENIESNAQYIVGGDYFSRQDYDQASMEEDKLIARLYKKKTDKVINNKDNSSNLGFYTETLAKIYTEQGYFIEAKKIYQQLLLNFPEKNAYFASLIEDLEKLTNN